MISAFGVDHGYVVSKYSAEADRDGLIALDQARSNEVVRRQRTRRGYEDLGGGYHARHRKLSRGNSERMLEGLREQSKGHKGGDVYYRSGYVNPVYRGLTVPGQGSEKDVVVAGYPPLLPNRGNRLKSRAIGTHEGQHVKELAGQDHIKSTYTESFDAAKGKSRNDTARTVNSSNRQRMAGYEGSADKAIRDKYGVVSSKLGLAYPFLGDKDFKQGYRDGGGVTRNFSDVTLLTRTGRQDSRDYRAAKKEYGR